MSVTKADKLKQLHAFYPSHVPEARGRRHRIVSWMIKWSRYPLDGPLDGMGRFDFWVLGFVSGIALYFGLPFEPPTILLWLTGAGGLCAGILHRILPLRWFIQLGSLVLVVSGMLLGFTWSQAHTNGLLITYDPPELVRFTLPSLTYEGQLRSLQDGHNATHVILDVERISWDKFMPERVRIRLQGRLRPPVGSVLPGDVVSVRAVIGPLLVPPFPNAIDLRQRGYFAELAGAGFGTSAVTIVSRAECWVCLGAIRTRLANDLKQLIPGQGGALAAALLVGDRSGISEETYHAFRSSGLSHLLAISGLHVGLVTALVFGVVRAISVAIPGFADRWPIKSFAACMAIFVAAAYVLLSGASIPTIRAFVMAFIVLCGVVVARRALSKRLVSIAALLVLLHAPSALLSASFQMSFAAVLSLIAVYQGLRGRADQYRSRSFIHRIWQYIVGIVVSTLVAGTATGLIAAVHFNTVATYGSVVNVFAIPLTAFWIMPFGLLTLSFWPFGGAEFLAQALGHGLNILLSLAHMTDHWSHAEVFIPALPFNSLPLIGLGLVLVCWSRHLWIRVAAILGLICLAILPYWTPAPDVIVASNGAVAVRKDQTLYILGVREDTFVADVWSDKTGLDHIVPYTSDLMHDGVTCDQNGCRIDTEYMTVTTPLTALAVWQDCQLTVTDMRPLFILPVKQPALNPCSAQTLRRSSIAYGAQAYQYDPDTQSFVAWTQSVWPWPQQGRPWQD